MADRRMFTKKITDDERFYMLPASTQLLYFHLSMSADDDGFCNQVSVAMFKSHASIADLETLLDRRYLYQFENGVIVIKHWRMANALRKDRYTPTVFQEELAQLGIKDNGSYTRLPNGCQMVATCLPQDRLGKDRLDNIKNIVEYLNSATGKNFRSDTANTVKHINARLNEGYTVEDFKTVIDTKVKEWKCNDQMEKYLRPDTLFGSKFESYLNQGGENNEQLVETGGYTNTSEFFKY